MEKKYQMDAKFGRRWIKALRSGKFGQTIGKLKENRTNEYCCLGVACKISGIGADVLNVNEWIEPRIALLADRKIPELLISLPGNKFVVEVSEMNDNGKTFPEIADWIEQNVELT